jgi:oligopeptide transport system permease protein
MENSYSLKINKRFLNKKTIFGFFIIFLLIILSIFAPVFSKYSYFETNLEIKNTPPCFKHFFGTDELGRDIFTRVFIGCRISLFIGITAAVIDMIIGVIYGAISGYFGKKTDEIMMRLSDIISSVPYLLTAILLMVVMGSGIKTIIIAITLTGWINMARIIRAQVLSIKKLSFIEAGISYGASNMRIIFLHILPNLSSSIITTVAVSVPLAIFTEAFLSFLGLGVQAPTASLGVMVSDSLSALRYYPFRLFFPASIIFIIMFSFNLLSDGLRDLFDPQEINE